ncbi:MAG: SGNH/GDSL hydrolase family protein [Armatimonadota bacterium]
MRISRTVRKIVIYAVMLVISISALVGWETMALANETATAPGVESAQHPLLKNVKRIVFVGDSLTDGAAWPDWVVETLAAHGHPQLILHNAGVAGNTVAQVKARYRNDVIALKPDLVIMHIGTNDVNTNVKMEDYRRDLDEVVKGIRAGGARLLLLTPPAMREPERNTRLYECDAIMRELAKIYDCQVCDVHAAFDKAAREGVQVWGEDGVHHQIDGWRTIARTVLTTFGYTAPLVEKIPLYPKSITDWFISPPIEWKNGSPVPTPDVVDTFDPKAAGWTPFDRNTELQRTAWWQRSWLERGGITPMGGPESIPGKGAFALARVTAGKEETVTMHVGGSPPLFIWLNGKLIWQGTTPHGYHPDADRFTVTLRKGENRIIVFSTWLFHVSLGDI